MDENKEQKIVVFLSLKHSDKMLILNGIKIASIFRKELCLLYNYSKNEKNQYEKFKALLNDYTVAVKNEIPHLKISTLLLSEKTKDLPELLADEYEVICLIANSNDFKHYSKALPESPVPFLFVNPESEISEFNRIILPIDLRKENSDSALWSSYFGRFNNSEINVVAANDKGKDCQGQVTKNVVLTKKIYNKFEIRHKVFKGTKSSFQNSFEALQLALSTDCNLLIILGSSTITPLDLLIGLPERKIINKAKELPVLVVNPRRDNYILCD